MYKILAVALAMLVSHTVHSEDRIEGDQYPDISPTNHKVALADREQKFKIVVAPHVIPYMHFTGIGPAFIGINLDLDYGSHTVGINRTINTWSVHYKYYFFGHQKSWYLGIHHHTEFLGNIYSNTYSSTSIGGTIGYIWDSFYTEIDSHQFISPSHLRPFLIFVPEVGWRIRF